MKILILHNRYREFGGEDAVVDGEITLLRGSGHEVETILWSNDDLRTDGPVQRAATLGNSIWSRAAWREVRHKVVAFRPDLVHVHNTLAAASPAVLDAADLPGVALVHTLHNFRHLCLNGLLFRSGHVCTDCVGTLPWRGVSRACYRGSRAQSLAALGGEVVHRGIGTWNRIDRYIALSEHSRRLHIDAGFAADRIVVKPQTLELDPGDGEHREDFVLFAGRLVVEKGIHVLARAWREARFDFRLVIAGEGPEAEGLGRELGSVPGVTMLGRVPRPELVELMKQSRIVVLPSLWFEGFPVTLLEALATGCAVIASDIGAIPEIVTAGETGILVPPGDPAALAHAIRDLHASPDVRERLGRNARRSFGERFSAQAAGRALIDIYRDACAAARKTAAGAL